MKASRGWGLGRSEPQLAGTRPGAVAKGAPRVALVGFYGPGRTVWVDAGAGGPAGGSCQSGPPRGQGRWGVEAARAARRAAPLTLSMLEYLSGNGDFTRGPRPRRRRSLTRVDKPERCVLSCFQSLRRQAGCRVDASPAWAAHRAALGVLPMPPLVRDSGAGAFDSLTANRRLPVPMSFASSEVVVLLLTVPDAAKSLGVCRRTLERLIEAGEFPRPVKIRGVSRVPSSDVQCYVEKLLKQRAS